MKKRVILVTGSSRGIGLAIAKEFIKSGDYVVLNGRTDAHCLDMAVKEFNSPKVIGILADMSNYARAQEVFEEIALRFASVEVLVNNAGISHFGLFTNSRPSDWDELMRYNFNSVLNSSHLAVPSMVQAKKGVIINISSIWAAKGASCEAVYAASKGAVNSFTLSLAKELGPSGVRVCAVSCGAIETRMNDRLTVEEREAFTDEIPLMRFGKPEEVGQLVHFIASEKAAYLTGQIVGLDGGV